MLVIDASVTLAWVFPDEQSDYAQRAVEAVEAGGGLVPAIWSLEVGNALLMAERRKRITPEQVSRGLALLRQLPLQVATPAVEAELDDLPLLARELGLTTYDASYIAAALRTDLMLATLDGKLRTAAASKNLQLFAPSN